MPACRRLRAAFHTENTGTYLVVLLIVITVTFATYAKIILSREGRAVANKDKGAACKQRSLCVCTALQGDVLILYYTIYIDSSNTNNPQARAVLPHRTTAHQHTRRPVPNRVCEERGDGCVCVCLSMCVYVRVFYFSGKMNFAVGSGAREKLPKKQRQADFLTFLIL